MMTGGGDTTEVRLSRLWISAAKIAKNRFGKYFIELQPGHCRQSEEVGPQEIPSLVICIYAVTRQSKICRGCSVQKSVAGCNTMGGITARRYTYMRQLDRFRWPDGLIGSTKSCAGIYGLRHIGLRAFRVVKFEVIRTLADEAYGAVPRREPDHMS